MTGIRTQHSGFKEKKASPVDSEVGLNALGPRKLPEDDAAVLLLDGL